MLCLTNRLKKDLLYSKKNFFWRKKIHRKRKHDRKLKGFWVKGKEKQIIYL